MKKKFIRNLLLCIIGITGFVCCNERVGAIQVIQKQHINNNFENGDKIKYEDSDYGLPELYFKRVKLDDRVSTLALCTYFSKGAPSPGSIFTPPEVGTVPIMVDSTITELDKIGIAAIANQSDMPELGFKYHNFTDIHLNYLREGRLYYAAQDIAVNLYLSYNHGNLDRFKCSSCDFKIRLENGKVLYFNEYDSAEKLVNDMRNNPTRAQKAVIKLYDLAKNAADAKPSETPKLWFTDNSAKQFTYSESNKMYSAIFEVKSNIQIEKEEIKVDIQGVTDKSRVSFNPIMSDDGRSARITVSFPEDIVEDPTVEVTVKARAMHPFSVVNLFAENTQPLAYVQNQNDFKYLTISDRIRVGYSCPKLINTCDVPACTNAQSSATCSSSIEYYISKTPCDNGTKATGIKTVDVIEGVCSLYCTESATVSYPGNAKPVAIPNNLVWPSTINGPYPLATHAKLTCKLEMNDGSALTDECRNKLRNNYSSYKYNNNGEAYLKYTAPKLVDAKYDYIGPANFPAVDLKQSCQSSTVLNEDGVSVQMINNCSYTLPSTFNGAISKDTLEYVKTFKVNANEAIKNYILMKNGGVIPIGEVSWFDSKVLTDTLFKSKYQLTPTVPLGYNNQLGSTLNSKDYTCHYNVTTDIEGRFCYCPTGTKREGDDLYPDIATYNKNNPEDPINCAEAQHRFCDILIPNMIFCPPDSNHPQKSLDNCLLTHDYATCVQLEECYGDNDGPSCTTVDGEERSLVDCMNGTGSYAGSGGYDEVTCVEKECPNSRNLTCPPGTVRAGEKLDEIYVKSCISSGQTEAWCINEYCNIDCPPGQNCEYTCPKNSDKYPMDITSCIGSERGKGKTLQQALDTCYLQCYNDSGKNAKIIYRTISLENPFPSMDADKSVSSSDLSIGKFNDTVKGRYPGTNWNGITLVKDKILNNRGYDGSSIYKEAEPLYVIDLDAASIKKIRAYNKEQNKKENGYADFTLNCTDGAYCISTFLHDKLPGFDSNKRILDGTCANINNKADFNKCYITK